MSLFSEVQTIEDEESHPHAIPGPTPSGPSPGGGEVAADPPPTLAETDEREGVHMFLRTHQNNSGVIDLLNEFLIELAHIDHLLW